MKCLHCLVEFHAEKSNTLISQDKDHYWVVEKFSCPACGRDNLFLANYIEAIPHPGGYGGGFIFSEETQVSKIPIRPKGIARPPCPTGVPNDIKSDYEEASLVLIDSPKASAALSRRCLQTLLRDAASVTPNDLSKEIDQVLATGKLPTYLSEMIDAVRNVGNFAAHPQKSLSTGLILPVEPYEAEWNLEVLEALFDFYYVLPQKTRARQKLLNKKLADAGKPPIKASKP